MANIKTYNLTLDAQELRDVIEAELVCERQNAEGRPSHAAQGLRSRGTEAELHERPDDAGGQENTGDGGEGMKKLILTTAEWLHLKWILERNMIRMDAEAFRLKEGEPGSEARREAIGKELESIEKERRNIEWVLEKIKAAESVQDGTEEKK